MGDGNFYATLRARFSPRAHAPMLTAPDGASVSVARHLGFKGDVALVFATARALVWNIRENFDRSITALHAHGIVKSSWASRLSRLPQILALTWTASLDQAYSRSDTKWKLNRFVLYVDKHLDTTIPSERFTTFACYCFAILAISACLVDLL